MKPRESTNRHAIPACDALESRILLDSQIGVVSMPYDGYLSAAIYDSNDQIVRTLFSHSAQVAGDVPLIWDGKDDVGRTVLQDTAYKWKALINQVSETDQGGIGDSAYSSTVYWPSGDYFDAAPDVQAVAVDSLGGATHVGGNVRQVPDRQLLRRHDSVHVEPQQFNHRLGPD